MPYQTRNSFLEDLIAICNRHGQSDFIEILTIIYKRHYGIVDIVEKDIENP